ncbi:MAG: flippase-like domain-containing protein [Holophaga sp.]|nr:flippase-like domain-containing protein [Holophaga sp.]
MRRPGPLALLGWTLAAGFLAWVGLTFEWRSAWGILRGARLPVFLSVTAATLPLFFLMRTLRWQSLLPDQARSGSLLDRYLAIGIAVGLGSVVPLQGAEILKVEAGHSGSGLGRKRGYSALLLERCLDLVSILLLFFLCYPRYLPPQGRALAATLLSIALAGLLLAPWLGRIPGTGRFEAWGAGFRNLVASPGRLAGALASTAAAWLLVLVGWYGVLASLQIHLPFTELAALMSGIALLGIFSLIPGGIGICELGITGMLVLAGAEPARAQGAALLLRCYSLASAALGLAFLLWQRHRPEPRSRRGA